MDVSFIETMQQAALACVAARAAWRGGRDGVVGRGCCGLGREPGSLLCRKVHGCRRGR